MQVQCAEDCGNAPKKRLLRDLCIDHWGDEGAMFGDYLTDEAVWHVIGEAQTRHVGKDVVHDALQSSRIGKPAELHIHNIITHGNTASLNATVVLEDGNRIEYCDVYRFAGFGPKAKIKEITSYRFHIAG